jgi:hypothetical protein
MKLFSVRVARTLAFMVLFAVIMTIGIWGTLALAIRGPENFLLRYGSSAFFGVSCLLCLIAVTQARWRWRGLIAYSTVFFLALIWWSGVTPANDRNWQEGVAVLPWAQIDGDLVTVHNIRNNIYRSETDYTVGYYDKIFDLRKLEGVDVIAVHWMGPAIAHVFLSFAFAGDQHLAISIETRNEKGEGYSTLQGFFRQYELHYVVADERDVIRLRTNFRHNPNEDVYVYRARVTNGVGQRLFQEYLAQINSLKTTPQFYNTLTTNCATNIWLNSRVNPEHLPLNWKIIASGYLAQYLYDNGRVDTKNLSFSELQKQAWVNSRAQAADKADNFSQLIRTAVVKE